MNTGHIICVRYTQVSYMNDSIDAQGTCVDSKRFVNKIEAGDAYNLQLY